MRSAAIFPGQGSEYPGMLSCIGGAGITGEIFSRVNSIAGSDIMGPALRSDGGVLMDMRISQLAVFGTSVCYWHLLGENEKFHILAGHSLGFYAALYASGSVSLEDCVWIIMTVQDAIESASGNRRGRMASIIGLQPEEVEMICREAGDAYVSNINSATQIVISGWHEAVEKACRGALEAGALNVKELSIAYPLHSRLMSGIEEVISRAVASIEIKEPSIPVMSHLDSTILDAGGIAEILSGQLTKKVLWRDAVKSIRQRDINRFVEVGPSDVLSKLIRWIDRDAVSSRAEELAPCQAS